MLRAKGEVAYWTYVILPTPEHGTPVQARSKSRRQQQIAALNAPSRFSSSSAIGIEPAEVLPNRSRFLKTASRWKPSTSLAA